MVSHRIGTFVGVVVVATCTFTAAAHGEPSQETISSERTSATAGFGAKRLSVLERSAQTDRATAAAALVASLCESDCSASTSETDDSTIIGNSAFVVRVKGDGSWGEYIDKGASTNRQKFARPEAQRLPADVLERLGRDVIHSRLSSVVRLAPGESLYVVATAHTIGGGGFPSGAQVPTQVLSNHIVFGRKIAGVPVVGGGSRIRISFSNDESIESLRYDWGSYDVTRSSQAVVPVTKILERVRDVIVSRTGGAESATPVSAPSGAPLYPIPLTTTAQLNSLECGYYDPGYSARASGTPVQPGCAYHVENAIQSPGGSARDGLAGAVPGTAAPLADASWPEVTFLAGRNPPKGAPAPSTAPQP